jgi:transcriptional regulator with XRE-family HTH domain
LRAIRKAKGLTTASVAKILGVSQAKISYIEHCKGVLSARDVALLAKKLNVPVLEFFRGIDQEPEPTEREKLAGQLIHYGATLLANPSWVVAKYPPFEEVFSKALGYIEDDRLHKAFCAALVNQAATKEINTDHIFALTGNNLFLLRRVVEEVQVSLAVIENLNRYEAIVRPRAKRQLEKVQDMAKELSGAAASGRHHSIEEIAEITEFVGKCLHAKK